MHGHGILFEAFIYLLAALVSVPLAKRLGLGSVLGYLGAGIVIGPAVLGLVGAERGVDVMHFAEFGVVMMLFLIGLELRPALLWRMRGPILGLGGMQVAVTAAAVFAVAMVLGIGWRPSAAIGMMLALSSTAIVLQTLTENGLLKSKGGQASFSVLLFQDIAVIPMLAILPLLAPPGLAGADGTGADGLPGGLRGIALLAIVVAIVLGGRFIMAPLFRAIARTRLQEIFTAAALVIVIGIALAMESIGVSPALGTFLAGVVLADSEYRHELEETVEPFKGLLLGLFFISVGAGINFDLVREFPAQILLAVTGLVLLKMIILIALGMAFRLGRPATFLLAFAVPQAGEFAFVLTSFAMRNGVLDNDVASKLVVIVALSMAVTPLLLVIQQRWIAPRLSAARAPAPDDTIDLDEENPVIIAGFGRFGHIVGRYLRAQGIGSTVLDLDPDHIALLRKLDLKIYYGDASKVSLLRAAGAESARVLVIALDDVAKSLQVVRTVRRHFPHLTILARAAGRSEAYELIHEGVEHVYRETLDTSLEAGIQAARILGRRGYNARRAARAFRRLDEESVRELASIRHDEIAYVSRARQHVHDLEGALKADRRAFAAREDQGWELPPSRPDQE